MGLYTSAQSDDFKQSFIKQIEEQVFADSSTLQELKRCFNRLQLGLLTRDQVSRDLMTMPTTSVRDLCVASNIECGDRDMEFMRKINDIHREFWKPNSFNKPGFFRIISCCGLQKFIHAGAVASTNGSAIAKIGSTVNGQGIFV
ncbi:hypothetical protein Hdeb2414_s0002g00052111 [Helianthus debilis subsp. tardiflorus]